MAFPGDNGGVGIGSTRQFRRAALAPIDTKKEFRLSCTNCGLDNDATADFCLQCGQQMAGSALEDPAQSGPLRRFGGYLRQLFSGGADSKSPS